MVVPSHWRGRPSAVERSAPSTTAALTAAAETLQSHLEFVLDERAGGLNAEQRRFLDVAVRYGERLVRLADDLRIVALAEAGELETAPERFDLVGAAHAAVEHVWPVARVEGKPIELRHDGESWIEADRKLVARGLHGLLVDVMEVAVPGRPVAVAVGGGGVEVAYEGAALPAESSLALVEATARLLGGELVVCEADGRVSLAVTFAAARVALRAA